MNLGHFWVNLNEGKFFDKFFFHYRKENLPLRYEINCFLLFVNKEI